MSLFKNTALTIKDCQSECYETAVEKGWADRPVEVPEQIALICAEACEALEEYRDNMPVSYEVDGKPEGIGAEYADIVIRVFHYATLLGVNMEYELRRKMAYNKTRPYRHGGKKA